ncbi:colicin E3/pyocin S6 family cytotoxin [Enterovibrio sp. Hal110]
MLPSGSSSVSIQSSLARGDMVVVSDNPTTPLFKYADGKLVANPSNQITLTDQAVNDAKQRFLTAKPRMGTSQPANNSPSSTFSESNYVPEPVVTEPPLTPTPPPAISENFAKAPQADKVFAKSCTRPYGDTQACDEEIKAPNFGVMAAMAPARAMTANGLLPLGKVAGTTSRMPLNWALAGDIAKSAASRANFLLLAFWPSQLGDGTLYTDEELAQLPEAVTRVRFRLFQDEKGNPQALGIHTGEGSSYGDTVRRISADTVGENFEAVVDEDLTLTWFPDDSENIFKAGSEYPDSSGLEISNILVRPIDYDGQELDKLIYPNPEAEHIELIVTFPPNSGIAPLYLVFSKPIAGLNYVPAPRGSPPLPAFPDAVKAKPKTSVQGGGKKRARWKDKKRIYEWDSQHGKVEVYDKNGNHIGEFDHNTGEQTKPKDPKRKVEK